MNLPVEGSSAGAGQAYKTNQHTYTHKKQHKGRHTGSGHGAPANLSACTSLHPRCAHTHPPTRAHPQPDAFMEQRGLWRMIFIQASAL